MKEHPLKRLRSDLGMNQAEFAKEIGVTPGRVCQIENGSDEWPLGSTRALKIAKKYRARMKRLGITLEDLLRGAREDRAAAS